MDFYLSRGELSEVEVRDYEGCHRFDDGYDTGAQAHVMPPVNLDVALFSVDIYCFLRNAD